MGSRWHDILRERVNYRDAMHLEQTKICPMNGLNQRSLIEKEAKIFKSGHSFRFDGLTFGKDNVVTDRKKKVDN